MSHERVERLSAESAFGALESAIPLTRASRGLWPARSSLHKSS
jgi:hypothetical protein